MEVHFWGSNLWPYPSPCRLAVIMKFEKFRENLILWEFNFVDWRLLKFRGYRQNPRKFLPFAWGQIQFLI